MSIFKRPSKIVSIGNIKSSKTPASKTKLHWAVIQTLNLPSQPIAGSSTPPSVEDATPDVNAHDELGRTALHWAAALNCKEWAEYIIKHLEADGVLRDIDGKLPLHEAVISGHDDIVELLLQSQRIRDNIDTQDNMHRTALQWAVDHGNRKAVLLLTACGANIFALDTSNHTALHRAVRSQNKDISTELIGKLTDTEKKNAMAAAIEHANERDHLDVAKAICQHHAKTIRSRIDPSELVDSRRTGPSTLDDIEMIDKMMNGSLESLLLCATDSGDETSVELLHKTDIGEDGWAQCAQRLLRLAARKGHDAIVKRLLLVENIQVNMAPSDNRPGPLLYAVQNGHEVVVRTLLRVADIRVNGEQYLRDGVVVVPFEVPLLTAIREGYTAIVELLLGHKDINVDAIDQQGITPLSLAARNGEVAMTKLLLENNACVELAGVYGLNDVAWAAIKSHCDIIRLHLQNKAETDTPDLGSRTPLSHAAAGSHEDSVKLLLEYGANYNSTGKKTVIKNGRYELEDTDAKSPQEYAFAHGHNNVGELLQRQKYR
ncbi:hypothetical protein PG996_004440 [Apiospora saccharicola]|uniref:Ankyrin n=1 Tax=Apiospora saccharicola TaxID=335842 RepID=A0ABR1W463_9PEZI